MSLLEQQNFLARLYTDEDLRRRFLTDPRRAAREAKLTDDEIAELAAVVPDEVEFFAQSLFWKRLREAEKFLPLTKAALGADWPKYFAAFAISFSPRTVKKHLEDAFQFCHFLQSQRSVPPIVRDAARFEQAKMKIHGYGQKFAFCRLKSDLREISGQAADAGNGAPARNGNFAVWIKIGNKIRYFNL